jgi:plasmid stabilization system protein ParE
MPRAGLPRLLRLLRVAGEEVIVVAVFHGKRQPEVLKKRR